MPNNKIEINHWIFNYCGNLLSWKLFEAKEGLTHHFHEWFNLKFPEISKESYNLRIEINDDFKSPDTMHATFKKIFYKFELKNKMGIVNQ